MEKNFVLDLIIFILDHSQPETVLDVISILNESTSATLDVIENVFKNSNPINTARCWSFLFQRNLLGETRREKLIAHHDNASQSFWSIVITTR